MKPKPTHFWNRNDRDIWTLRGPSRRLRKLYQELDALNAERDAVRNSNPVPEHAPSSFVARREAMRPLDEAYYRLLDQIARLQNDADDPPRRRYPAWTRP